VELSTDEDRPLSDIIIPDAYKDTSSIATVLAVGPGKLNGDGTRQETPCKVGDKVFTPKYGGIELEIGGKQCKVLTAEDIPAIYE
jgi:chaperonin GroES